MTRLQCFAAMAVLAVALVAIGSCTVQTCRLHRATQRAETAESDADMKAEHFTKAEAPKVVKVPINVPKGAKPVAVVEGTVGYGPRRTLSPGLEPPSRSSPAARTPPGPGGETATMPARPPEPGGDAAAGASSGTAPAWPTPDDLAGGCRTYFVEAQDGAWWARSFWTGKLRLQDGGEIVRPDVELEMQRVEVRRFEQQEPAKRLAWGLRRPRHWRTGWVAGIGVAYDPLRATWQSAAFAGYAVQF